MHCFLPKNDCVIDDCIIQTLIDASVLEYDMMSLAIFDFQRGLQSGIMDQVLPPFHMISKLDSLFSRQVPCVARL